MPRAQPISSREFLIHLTTPTTFFMTSHYRDTHEGAHLPLLAYKFFPTESSALQQRRSCESVICSSKIAIFAVSASSERDPSRKLATALLSNPRDPAATWNYCYCYYSEVLSMMKVICLPYLALAASLILSSVDAQGSGGMCRMCASGTPANAELIIPFLAIGK